MDGDGQLLLNSGNVTLRLQDLADVLSEVSSLKAQLSSAVSLTMQQNAQIRSLSLCALLPTQLNPFQSIATTGADDWEYFSIDGQSYLAVANERNDTTSILNSQIFKFNGSAFAPFQSIPAFGVIDIQPFVMDGQSFLALANHYNYTNGAASWTHNLNSQIFKFNGSTFTPFQSIPTSGAHDWEYFTIDNQAYLALANFNNDSSFNINSQILKYNGSAFVPFQSIPTSGATDWKYFNMLNRSYLAVANARDSNTNTNVNSQILVFNGTNFVHFQFIQTNDAHDWEYISIENQSFLAVANMNSSSSSQIFRFNGTAFVLFQSVLPSGGGFDWEYFKTNSHQSYLALANASGSTSESLIFKFDGHVFVPILSVPSSGARDWCFFEMENQPYLAFANFFNGNLTNSYSLDSQIFSVSACW